MIIAIEDKIKQGIESAYLDIIAFNKELNSDIKPEYLVTVNVAQKIGELNKPYDREQYPLRIKLEERARRLLNICREFVPATTVDELFTLNYWKDLGSDIKPKSKERVDIAIYDNDEKPLALIEVKKFTLYPKTLKKDIKRNLNFLGFHNHTIYDSQLKNSYLVFLINDNISINESEVNNKIDELKVFYAAFLVELNIPNIINSSIDVYSITNSLITRRQLGVA